MKESTEMGQAEANSSLARALRSGRLAVTAEYAPPETGGADAVKRSAAAFPPSLDALVVSDGGGRGISAVVCSTLLAGQGMETALTLLTRDRNRSALLSDVRGAAALGVRNVLCLPGDHQSLGPQPEAAAAYDVDPVQLIGLLNELEGDAGGPLFIGAEAYAHLRPLELSLIDVRKKVRAGARFLLTRPVFDPASFQEWMSAVRQEGLHERASIIAGVQPLAGVEQAEPLRRRLGIPDEVMTRLRESEDAGSEGIAVCAETAAALKGVDGVRGVHIMGGGTPDVVAAVIAGAGLAPA
jgi:methylenetetrahydrofolate reductase (NADPH)